MVQRSGDVVSGSAPPAEVKIGPVADRYEVGRLVGRGPHGSVWRAVRRGTTQQVAVKLLHERFASNPEVRDRLSREYRVLTAYLHPAQVRLRDLILGDEVALVFELVIGSDLRRVGAFTSRAAAETVAQAAEALAAAHAQGVVHCGIKPANLLLDRDSGQLRITDSRIGRLVRGFRPDGRHGDPRYVAPEVLRGGSPVPASDVYALGLVLQELLTGTPGDPGPVHPPRSTGVVWDVLEACLAVDPAARPSAAQLAEELDRAVADGWGSEPAPTPVPHRAEPPPVATSRRRRRSRIQRLVLAGVLVGTGAAVLLPGVLAGSPASSRFVTVTGPAADAATAPGPTPSPTLRPVPTEATAQGATDFVQYWFDVLNYAGATGDAARVQAASSPGCGPCTAAADAVRAGYRDGGRLWGGTYTVRRVVVDGFFDPDRTVVVGTVFDRSPLWTVSADGTRRQQSPGATFTSCQVLLTRTGDRWQVIGQQCGQPG